MEEKYFNVKNDGVETKSGGYALKEWVWGERKKYWGYIVVIEKAKYLF
jgi:hypothetical protein